MHLNNSIICFQVVEISGGGDLMTSLKDLDFLPGFALEGYPNRDSTLYADLYGIRSEVNTILRGTLRYKGQNVSNYVSIIRSA